MTNVSTQRQGIGSAFPKHRFPAFPLTSRKLPISPAFAFIVIHLIPVCQHQQEMVLRTVLTIPAFF